MGRKVDVDELVDATDVARILGLANPTSVHVYSARYSDMPLPVIDRGPRRAKLWLRSEVVEWHRRRKA
jgi:predicted DNA-binding transcriptional regulator AlpA